MTSPFVSEKMFRYPDRLALGLRGDNPPPVTVELDLTNACNHACPDCTFSYLVNVDQSSIPYDLAGKLVGQLADLDVKALTFSGGGEPLVYGVPRVLALMALARHEGLEVALITNGSLLRDERFLDLCSWVRVSLDAYDAETFQRFHGRGAKEFAKVVDNVRHMAHLAMLRRAEGRPCATFGVGFLTDRGSVGRGDVLRMAEFCARIEGLSYVQFRPLTESMVSNPSLNGGYEGRDLHAEVRALLSQYERAQFLYGGKGPDILLSADKYNALLQPHHDRNYHHCHAHFLQATVSADARVYICCHGQGQEGYCLGDLRQHSFAEIWRSEQAETVRESIDPAKQCPPVCRLHPQNVLLQQLLTPGVHDKFI